MIYNLWVDDEREPPEDWGWAKTNVQAIEMLAEHRVTHLALDYILGRGQTTDDIMYWLRDHPEHWPLESITCHSSSSQAQRLIEKMVKDFAPGG